MVTTDGACIFKIVNSTLKSFFQLV